MVVTILDDPTPFLASSHRFIHRLARSPVTLRNPINPNPVVTVDRQAGSTAPSTTVSSKTLQSILVKNRENFFFENILQVIKNLLSVGNLGKSGMTRLYATHTTGMQMINK